MKTNWRLPLANMRFLLMLLYSEDLNPWTCHSSALWSLHRVYYRVINQKEIALKWTVCTSYGITVLYTAKLQVSFLLNLCTWIIKCPEISNCILSSLTCIRCLCESKNQIAPAVLSFQCMFSFCDFWFFVPLTETYGSLWAGAQTISGNLVPGKLRFPTL